MRSELAENLLSAIMEWDDSEKATERIHLEHFATYKYDQYQQFAPGRRFLESLAQWLKQFDDLEERQVAYEFVKKRLIFISSEEMNTLVDLTFPTIIRPILLQDAAEETGHESTFRVKQLTRSPEYEALRRRMLVLGLSDGARTDWFRRLNPHSISHEQVFHAYDISDEKANEMRASLTRDMCDILGRQPVSQETSFRYVVLLDDFSASGLSYVRRDDDPLKWKGKIPKVLKQLEDQNGLGAYIASSNVRVIVVLYIASSQAISHIKRSIEDLTFSKGTIELHVVFPLSDKSQLNCSNDPALFDLLQKDEYFDAAAYDEHAKVGGPDIRLGFADCRLPVVLGHNTPNNSLYILWAEEGHSVEGLFPRVSRHRRFD